ncbi:hypothetical protein C6P42_002854 [Pichia californica]|nr:hypothetical protein C6P42_002854 [[Candida] californica]
MSDKELESQFRNALTEYENKNYKKSLLLIDKILKKDPMNSQSYALKALVYSFYHPINPTINDPNLLSNLPNKTLIECNDLINLSIKYDPSNSISSHLIALFYRQIKNYEKAAHFYTITISKNPNNKAVLRDLASCLSQLRTFNSLSKIRFDYLQSEPGYRQNYSSTAISYDLLNDYNSAIKICNQIDNLIKDKLIDDDLIENSECIIYKINLLIKNNQLNDALLLINNQLISTEKFKCYDKTGLLELKYKILFKLNKFNEAQYPIRELLKRNPDNLIYYNDLIISLKIENNSILKLKLFNKLSKFYPNSNLPSFLPLTFLIGNDFQIYLKNYLLNNFKKGIPSIFSIIKSLYKNSLNHEIILKIIKSIELLEKNPLILTWIKYFISQHYYKLNDFNNSLLYINNAINLTPTLIELYMFKARILKHQNKLFDASIEMNIARLMDLQDRFLNSKSVKYYLRADLIDNALETISLFTKKDDENIEKSGIKDLHNLQCCWFIEEYAESMTRLFKKKLIEFKNINQDDNYNNLPLIKRQIESYLGLSLQRYFSIFSIYAEYYDDQYDFHFYAFRKGTLRSYLELINWSNGLYHQSFIGRTYSNLMSLISFLIDNKIDIEIAIDLTGINNNKRSKKDKKDEIKWKEHFINYNKVSDSDPLGNELINSIFKNNDYSKLDLIEKLISKKDDKNNLKPENLNFLNGEFNYYFIIGKYVVALSTLRKVKSLSNNSNKEGERAKILFNEMYSLINHFINKNSDDPKIISLQKIVKLGLNRI